MNLRVIRAIENINPIPSHTSGLDNALGDFDLSRLSKHVAQYGLFPRDSEQTGHFSLLLMIFPFPRMIIHQIGGIYD